ncbi:MAG: FMN-binding protein, partial [Flavobacteriales bacterium]|nr:FMN-binding protein [Flavobacteriales bacterium]
NPKWKAKWPGVKLFDASGNPVVRLVKSPSPEGSPGKVHEVDALSGASFTSRGVQNLVNFWTGELGFGPFIANLKSAS